jgi:diacylglycerol kinase (ATP)
MRVGIVRNPVSGRGAGSRDFGEYESKLRAKYEVLSCQTTSAGSARQQARELVEEGCEIVVAAGGDGTVTDVMQGILGSQATLAIIPTGTGNDFARTIGIGASVPASFEALLAGKRKLIDVAAWRIGSREGHFLNVAGCGFDAAVAHRINSGLRFLTGRAAYLAAIGQCLRSYSPIQLVIEADGQVFEERLMLFAIANAKSYGGGMLIAPTAEIDDGLLDLVMVRDMSKPEFLRSFGRVLKGSHLSHPKVSHLRACFVTFSSPGPFLVDGELLAPGKVEIQVVPNALEVIVP